MEVIGVIDLRNGQAVHARGGVREAYPPVRLPGESPGDVVPPGNAVPPGSAVPPGNAVALARHYARLGVRTLYVADLDAIEGRAPQWGALDALVATGMPLWVDAAVTTPAGVASLRARGVSTVVVGLETLPSLDRLPVLVAEDAGASAALEERLVLSLDLRNGVPLVTDPVREAGMTDPVAIGRAAAAAGIRTMLLLDLARVGAGTGVDTTVLAELRAALPPAVRLTTGGGLATRRDLDAARDAGCAAVLVASALLDGRLTAADVHAVNSRR